MSLYNMVYGVQPGTFYFIPMLGDKHAEEYPRFRDCFLGRMTRDADTDEMGMPLRKTDYPDTRAREVTVYTRVGGGNRESLTRTGKNKYVNIYSKKYHAHRQGEREVRERVLRPVQ